VKGGESSKRPFRIFDFFSFAKIKIIMNREKVISLFFKIENSIWIHLRHKILA